MGDKGKAGAVSIHTEEFHVVGRRGRVILDRNCSVNKGFGGREIHENCWELRCKQDG